MRILGVSGCLLRGLLVHPLKVYATSSMAGLHVISRDIKGFA